MASSVIVDFDRQRRVQVPDGAVVIVGSGAAGMALAESLAAAGRPVVLLESGRDLKPTGSGIGGADDRNEGINAGQSYLGPTKGRSRNLGGTTQLWHGQCMRLHDIDVEARPWVPFSGWPIALSDLDADYLRAEEWLDVSGLGYGVERWIEHPELPPLNWNSDRLLHDFTEYTPKPMLGRVHRRGLRVNQLIQVVVNATVSRVLLDQARTTDVEVVAHDGSRTTLPATEVVLAAGAIENARLLQLSDPHGLGLGSGREHTGRYLQDHPIIRTAQIVPRDYRVLQDRYVALHTGNRRLFPKVRLAPAAQRREELLDATAVFAFDHDHPELAAARRLLVAARTRRRPEHPMADFAAGLRAPIPVAREAYRRFITQRATGTEPAAVWLQLWLEQVPDPDSRIRLSPTVDSLGLRRPEVDWRIGDAELHTSRQMTRWIAEDLRRQGIAEVRDLPAMHDDDAWRATVTDAFHPAGTTRMADSPSDGVVDRNLKVHGVRGLHVVGGSVFPIAGYANPTLTIVALAIRLARHLTQSRN